MKKTAFILCVFSALMLTTCKKMPELKVYDLKLTSENVAYSQTSAEIKVEYDYPTDLQYVNVTMSESNYFGYSIVAQSEIIDSVFIANFVDLHTDKKYYYKFEYSNGVNVVTSEVRSFYLDAALVTLPTVITMEVSEIQGTSAICGGEIIDDGGYYVTGRGVCWSTHRNPTIFDNYTTDGMNTGSYTSTMTDLSEHTVYYVRAFAINEKGTSYGTEYSFETSGNVGLPTVTTQEVSDITPTSAKCKGKVTNTGGTTVTARGICWSTHEYPTIDDQHITSNTVINDFTLTMTGLTSGATYYVRAYATNEAGTGYGNQQTFSTIAYANGILPGRFSINATQKILFSQGNLQYQASTNTWRFAETQLDYIGDSNSNISATYDGWIDLFCWGTSGYNHGATCYQPYEKTLGDANYYAYGAYINDLNSFTGKADWGYNAISNGGNTENIWRTLSKEEWNYIINTRPGIRYAMAKVDDVCGMIILPDNWSNNIYPLNSYNTYDFFSSNIISLTNWYQIFQPNGAVFLPAAGDMEGTNVANISRLGSYHSSTHADNTLLRVATNNFEFTDGGVILGGHNYLRSIGRSVRLVLDAV